MPEVGAQLDYHTIRKFVRKCSFEEFLTFIGSNTDLISTSIKINHINSTSLLSLAVQLKRTDIVEFLFQRGANINNQPLNLLDLAIKKFTSWNKVEESKAIVKMLVENGAKFPDTSEECNHFVVEVFSDLLDESEIAIQFIEHLQSLGLDLKATESKAQKSLLLKAISRYYSEDDTTVLKFLLEQGLSIQPLNKDVDSSIIEKAIENGLFDIAESLIDRGADIDKCQNQLLFKLAESSEKAPTSFRDRLIGDLQDFDIQRKNYWGDGGESLLDVSLECANCEFVEYLVNKGVDIEKLNKQGESPLFRAIRYKQKKLITTLLDLGVKLNVINSEGKTALDIAMSLAGFKRVADAMKKKGAKTSIDLSKNLKGESAILETLQAYVQLGEPWADKLLTTIKESKVERLPVFDSLLRHCLDNNSSKPSKRWLKQMNEYIDVFNPDLFKNMLLEILPLVKEKRSENLEYDFDEESYYMGDSSFYMSESNTRLLKGLLWACYRFNTPEMCSALRDVAMNMYKKVYGVGMRNAKAANAALLSLSMMEGNAGVKEIVVLRASTKYNPAIVNINRVFDKLAKDLGMTSEELASTATPDYGLTDIAIYQQELADYQAKIEILGISNVTLTWTKGEKTQKAVPATIKKEYAAEIKKLKAIAKDLKVAISAHSQRIEQLYLSVLDISVDDFVTQYLDHKLIAFLARRLIWRVEVDSNPVDFIFDNGRLVDINGHEFTLPTSGNVNLWHPSYSNVDEIANWRNLIVSRQITQPFKQAHREIYRLTDAERNTQDHSLRFAGHLLNQHQFHALATLRAWKQNRGGSWDGGQETEAYRHIPKFDISVEFVTVPVEELGEGAIYDCLSTQKVIFYKNRNRIFLEQVDSLLFSEIMRDIDLFVAVASIGNDPVWREREGANNYWDSFGFGDLTQTAETRKEVLAQLIPGLKFGDKLKLDGNFLLVEGKLRQYKIHLGSSNILMEPDNSYLCIVPAATKSKKLYIPYEQDTRLSLILSKAMLLVADDKIKDKTIVSQIKR